jgi:hypothetical protein
MVLGIFGGGRIKSTESHIVGALFSGEHRQMARIMASDADDGAGANGFAGLGVRTVLLTDMDAVAAGFKSQVRPVVQDEGDAAALRFRTQNIDDAAKGVVFEILHAKLKTGDVARIQGQGHGFGKTGKIVELGRRDQVKAAVGRNFGISPMKVGGRQLTAVCDLIESLVFSSAGKLVQRTKGGATVASF